MRIRLAGVLLSVLAGSAPLVGWSLQQALDASMGNASGAALVLSVSSGQLLASYRLDVATLRLAAPGSTIKPFTLLALIHSGRFNPREQLRCHRTVNLAGHRLDCTHPDPPSSLDAVEALAYSCNSYFAKAGAHLTDKDLRQEFERAGFFSKTELLPREASGKMLHSESVEQLQLQALGASGIELTPAELAYAYRALARRRRDDHDPALFVVYAGLEGSTSYGMAHPAQPSGFAVAGKTGTASSPHSAATHGWFAGYAPAQNPRIVVVVYLERGRGMDAAAVAQKVFVAFQRLGDKR